MTLASLQNYWRDEVNDSANENKTKLIGSTPNSDSRLDAEVVVPLIY